MTWKMWPAEGEVSRKRAWWARGEPVEEMRKREREMGWAWEGDGLGDWGGGEGGVMVWDF